MNTFKKSIPFFIALFLILAIGIYSFVHKNHGITPIPADTVGNTAGNIRGEGLFCECNGKVYFSNLYDDGALYVMNPDCTEMERLNPSNVSYINAGGNYLFYYLESIKGGTGLGYLRATTGIYRTKLTGRSAVCLDKDMATMMVLAGDTLYLQHYDNSDFSTFNKIPASGSDEEIVLSKDIIETACVENGKLYYGGISNDHYLYAWDTRTDTPSVVWDGNVCYPTVIGNYVYYMDIDQDYRLFRYDLSSGEVFPMTQERIDFYNIYQNVIFYQTNGTSDPALMRMNIDGSGAETVMDGVYHRINTTSTYTYFQAFDQDDTIFRTSTFGPVAVDTFPEAMQAALENQG